MSRSRSPVWSNQPGPSYPHGNQNMQVPQSIPGCPPGLEYLTTIDQLLVNQKMELFEVLTGWETCNRYWIRNTMGQSIFFAVEDTDFCTRNCCGPRRPFNLNIMDNTGREVIHIYRPFRAQSCLFPCCLQEMTVCSPPGNIIGYIVQEWSIIKPMFSILNANEQMVLKVKGPWLTFSCGGDVEFEVLSADGNNTKVGKISKQWSGLVKEMFTDADNFGVSFPMDLDVEIKAVLLGACFLIDFMFFETVDNDN